MIICPHCKAEIVGDGTPGQLHWCKERNLQCTGRENRGIHFSDQYKWCIYCDKKIKRYEHYVVSGLGMVTCSYACLGKASSLDSFILWLKWIKRNEKKEFQQDAMETPFYFLTRFWSPFRYDGENCVHWRYFDRDYKSIPGRIKFLLLPEGRALLRKEGRKAQSASHGKS